ncbi:Subtilisin-like protease SBT2.5 [Abeliophyllum distichum]|uniref:Subtilisin-like protease SBT2.5 n=1 Tax=Abeliophyllum distichum TaxID=126358 RepID=A0ABD1P379_9LAMI
MIKYLRETSGYRLWLTHSDMLFLECGCHKDGTKSRATARILDGREATYTGSALVVASCSSRGPDVNNALLETADVLKPTIMAPGSSIWAAWSPNSEGDQYIKVPGVDDMSVRRAVGVGCPSKKTDWCSDLNTTSVTVSNLVGSKKVTRRVTNVGELDGKYTVLVREPFGVNISVRPQVFKISINTSRHITLFLVATQTANSYTFGEMVFEGNNNHVVRVPIDVYVSSTLGF